MVRIFVGWILLSVFSMAAMAQVVDMQKQANELIAQTQAGYYTRKFLVLPGLSIDPCNARNCARGALPVKLVYFTAERVDEGHISLKWETSEEVNNDHFQIERTLNPNAGFEQVGRVNAKDGGTYGLVDENGYDTWSYYRLKQVDRDGAYQYSRIIAVKGGAGELVVIPFPNPAEAGQIRFRMKGFRKATNASIVVYDVQGKMVYQASGLAISPASDAGLGLPGLPPGKYRIRLSTEDGEGGSSFVLIP